MGDDRWRFKKIRGQTVDIHLHITAALIALGGGSDRESNETISARRDVVEEVSVFRCFAIIFNCHRRKIMTRRKVASRSPLKSG